MDFQTPIMIPTKGRAGKTKTDKLMRAAGLSYCFVVEPQDLASYAATGSFHMVLPSNDMGITYARQWILEQMRKQGYKKFWMLDDDIECFGEAIDGKTVTRDASVLLDAFNQLRTYGPASMYSLELRQFAWSSKSVQRDKIAMQCVMFDMQHCEGINYDLRLKIREDYDISFQAIFKGKGTLKSGKYYYGIADMKSQEGGMSKYYNELTETHETQKLCRKWPGLVEPLKKKDRIDVKINWNKIK
jgi:hypothetical protein